MSDTVLRVTDIERLVEYCGLKLANEPGRWPDGKRVYRGSHYHFDRFGAGWDFFDQMLGGFIYSEEGKSREGWHYVQNWIDGRYRVVWVSPDQAATFTYCEGDLTLVQLDTVELYQAEMDKCARFYGRPICD